MTMRITTLPESQTVGYLHGYVERRPSGHWFVACDVEDDQEVPVMSLEVAAAESDGCPDRCRVYAVSEVQR